MTPQQQNDFLSALADTEVEITVKEHGKLEPSYGCIRSEACPFENRGPRFYLNNPNSLEARWLLRVCISEIKPISNEIFIIRYD